MHFLSYLSISVSFFYLSICLSYYLFICLCLFIYLTICPSTCLPNLSICTSICIHLSIYLSIYISTIYLSIYLSIYLCIHPFIHLSACIFLYLSPSVPLPVFLFVNSLPLSTSLLIYIFFMQGGDWKRAQRMRKRPVMLPLLK